MSDSLRQGIQYADSLSPAAYQAMISSGPLAAPDQATHAAALTAALKRHLQYTRPGGWYTQLNPAQQKLFEQWGRTLQTTNGEALYNKQDPTPDYDYAGYWLAMHKGDPRAVRDLANGHFPDIWKTPFEQSFSNESQYALPTAPHWVETPQGWQTVDSRGNVDFVEGR